MQRQIIVVRSLHSHFLQRVIPGTLLLTELKKEIGQRIILAHEKISAWKKKRLSLTEGGQSLLDFPEIRRNFL